MKINYTIPKRDRKGKEEVNETMDDVQLEERIDAGEQALEEQSKRPELQDLSLEVLTDLALHRWKCICCGESVLRHSLPYRVVRWKNGDPDNEVEYAVVFEKYWTSDAEENLEIIKEVKQEG